jgi:hypothetical protein
MGVMILLKDSEAVWETLEVMDDPVLFKNGTGMVGQPGGFKTAPVVDTDIDNDRTCFHASNHVFGNHHGGATVSSPHGSNRNIRHGQLFGQELGMQNRSVYRTTHRSLKAA